MSHRGGYFWFVSILTQTLKSCSRDGDELFLVPVCLEFRVAPKEQSLSFCRAAPSPSSWAELPVSSSLLHLFPHGSEPSGARSRGRGRGGRRGSVRRREVTGGSPGAWPLC